MCRILLQTDLPCYKRANTLSTFFSATTPFGHRISNFWGIAVKALCTNQSYILQSIDFMWYLINTIATLRDQLVRR